MQVAIGILIGLVAGGLGGAAAVGALGKSRLGAAQLQRKQLLDDAQREAETLRREAQITAREEAVKLRAEIDQEVAEHRGRIVKVEERVLAKEEEIDGKLTEMARREQGLADRETHLRQLQDEHKDAREQQFAELERISGMTVNEAKLSLLERSEDLVRHELARRVRQLEDGRIHPARIEDTYYASKAEIEDAIVQAGEQGVFEANCGEFHEELVKILGRLRYRTSYGQNVLKHTLEVVHLAGIMAAEVGASVKVTKRAALLHDLGKAMTHEVEGSHASISAQLARRYGESQHVVHAIEAHHYEVEPQTVEAVLLISADAISASRPGATGNSLEHYIKRLESLQELEAHKPGVKKVYALQAGREIRVIVKPTEIDDDAAVLLSHEIAREIEAELEYPGQGKGTGIRESRAVEFAK